MRPTDRTATMQAALRQPSPQPGRGRDERGHRGPGREWPHSGPSPQPGRGRDESGRHGPGREWPHSGPSPQPGRGRDERGILTLEWLLIVGAVAGLAATSVLAVQRVVDDTSEVPVDPLVRVLEADIAAAFVAAKANTAVLVLSPAYVDSDFAGRCTGLDAAFSDVLDPDSQPQWYSPVTIPGTPGDADTPPTPATLDIPARCNLTPRAGLGG